MLTVNPDDESEWASNYSLAENLLPVGAPASFPELPEPADGSNSWAHVGAAVGARGADRGQRPRTSTCAACPASGTP